MIALAVSFAIVETYVQPTDTKITTVQPIEHKYQFATYDECVTKLNELNTKDQNLTGLRCVPNGSND